MVRGFIKEIENKGSKVNENFCAESAKSKKTLFICNNIDKFPIFEFLAPLGLANKIAKK